MARYMPNLDGLDNGETPVLGIVETHAQADIKLPNGWVHDDSAETGPVAGLFDSYE